MLAVNCEICSIVSINNNLSLAVYRNLHCRIRTSNTVCLSYFYCNITCFFK